ncbi:DUF1279-domain-containing [Chlorella sorokiniana]|uniref:DUF1279-domain-containing n=1 Tax=Chlorella sorokiniana TaxID=3076 RepID=A0A2P6TVB7_CHLSO|nr:DUF1279-domain-containing [Chlorella sorokiniana]|eukprot:PRW58007.1 DUF1279-domain-containing [Chlorella sorokiniana]
MALALQQTAQPPRAAALSRHAPAPACAPAGLPGGWRRQRRRQQRSDALVLATKPDVGYKSEAEETTEKYGLEAGLWKVATNKSADGLSKTQQAKDLLARYGSAYLITSISFAIVSFAACYAAVDAGVDVASLLQRFGLQVTNTSETVGTFAIAYAAHKALSPVRFPPTVALTPLVAKWLGKEPAAPAAGGSE